MTALVISMAATSCMDDDWDNPQRETFLRMGTTTCRKPTS